MLPATQVSILPTLRLNQSGTWYRIPVQLMKLFLFVLITSGSEAFENRVIAWETFFGYSFFLLL